MDRLLSVAGLLDRIVRNLGKASGWLILPLIAVIMFDVVMRKIDFTRLYFSGITAEYGYSVSTILQDLEWHFHAVLLMLSFGFGYLANSHVRVDIFRELLPRRNQGWVEFAGLIILALPFLSIMIVYAIDMTVLSFNQGEGSDSLTGIDYRWVIKSVVPLGFVVVMAAVFATLIRLAGFLFGTDAQQRVALDGLEIFADHHAELDKAKAEAERLLREHEDGLVRAAAARDGNDDDDNDNDNDNDGASGPTAGQEGR